MKTMTKIFAGGVVMAMAVASLTAAPMLDWQDGTGGHAYAGWVHSAFGGYSEPDAITININGGSGFSMDGQQAIQITGGTLDNSVYASVFSTPAFSGNMTAYPPANSSVIGMQFDFYSAGNAPSGLGFFIQSNASVWFYDITPVAVSGWQTYGVSFGSSGWYGFDNVAWDHPVPIGDFANALTDVAAMGMYVYFNPSESGQVYGLGEFGLTVPEPETYVVIGIALLSIAFVFRRKITESLAEARAMIQM